MQSFSFSELDQKESISSFCDAYNNEGIVKVTEMFSSAEARAPVEDVLGIVANAVAPKDTSLPSDLNKKFQALCDIAPQSSEYALRLAKDIPSFQHLITHSRLRSAIAILLGDDRLICPFDWTLFRIDGKSTSIGHFNWHQDYSYNVISESAVTFWIPLLDIDEEMGPIQFVEGSHGKIYPVSIEKEIVKNNPNRISLQPNQEIEQLKARATSSGGLEQGSCILFNTLLLHASGDNRSADRYRWVANGRYARASDEKLVKREFYMARVKYPDYFKTLHPDLVSTEE